MLVGISKPNYSNYINIFGQHAQIIGTFNVKNADTGEYERLLKVMLSGETYKDFDTNGTNNWETSSLMQELNSEDILNFCYEYYKANYGNIYFDYDNGFGTIDTNIYTGVIANVEWDIGGLDSLNVSLKDAYKQEKGLTPYTSNKKTWTGKIGLPSLTDFLYEKLGDDCASDLSTCSTVANLSTTRPPYYLTLTKDNTSTSNMYVYDSQTYLPTTSQSGFVHLTFYLKKAVKFVCGDGTYKNPYAITPSECGELGSGK